jgi:hypothetical protein
MSVLIASCTKVEEAPVKKNEIINLKGQNFGAKITLNKATKISDILKTPKDFIDKKVLVKGTVTSVCSRRGCWMEIVGTEVGERIRIKVTDGQIVFPLSIKGKEAVVEGIVYSIHLKGEKPKPSCGEKNHKESDEGSGCQQKVAANVDTIYQIKGLGAVILN